ncbi:MAG: hypothetical protein ABUT20_62275, partial [Bacteroidota bacterium]
KISEEIRVWYPDWFSYFYYNLRTCIVKSTIQNTHLAISNFIARQNNIKKVTFGREKKTGVFCLFGFLQ